MTEYQRDRPTNCRSGMFWAALGTGVSQIGCVLSGWRTLGTNYFTNDIDAIQDVFKTCMSNKCQLVHVRMPRQIARCNFSMQLDHWMALIPVTAPQLWRVTSSLWQLMYLSGRHSQLQDWQYALKANRNNVWAVLTATAFVKTHKSPPLPYAQASLWKVLTHDNYVEWHMLWRACLYVECCVANICLQNRRQT